MNGIIAFFDILGYKSFLENNSIEESNNNVLSIISTAPQKAFEKMSKDETFSMYKKPDTDASFKHFVFSDTIVFTFSHKTNSDRFQKLMDFFFIKNLSVILKYEMFSIGLPLRGVIHQGEYFSQGSCLAGKGIIEAYYLSQSLNFSGLVLTTNLAEFVHKEMIDFDPQTDSNFKDHFPLYLTPQKENKETHLNQVNWLIDCNEDEKNYFKTNVELLVLKSFLSHNKDCPSSVDIKVHNTVKSIRHLLISMGVA